MFCKVGRDMDQRISIHIASLSNIFVKKARRFVNQYYLFYEESSMRFRLTAQFKDREAVKRLGARFDFDRKYWYYEGESLPEGLRRWYQENNPINPQMDLTVRENLAGRNMGARNETRIEFPENPALPHREGLLNGMEQHFMTVTELNRVIVEKYQGIEEFKHILVKGEVTNYRGHSGQHYYFDIKDENNQISCRLWEATARNVLGFELKRGQLVGISGCLEFYDKNGNTQLIVKNIVNLGDGDDMMAYLQLKERLTAEGLFAPEHKKEIPTHSKKVGIITSKNGDAIKDILQKAKERNPYVQLICYHVLVQGRNAIPTILRGIQVMDGLGCDVLIIGRGGGTLEELKVYDDESIVRAVYAANTPIISAVGHQAHTPLLDDVADFRVSTPTSAAEKVIPNVMADIEHLRQLCREMALNMTSQLERRKSHLREQSAVLERFHPERKLKEQKARLEGAREALDRNIRRILQEKQLRQSRQQEQLKWLFQKSFSEKKHRFEVLTTTLHGLSPTAKLVKGFGYISKDDQPVVSVQGVKVGDELRIRIHDGEIGATVTDKKDKNI